MPLRTFDETKVLKDFQEIIGSENPTVVDFYASWCGPCKIIEPAFKQLAEKPEFKQVQFLKIDIDVHEDIASQEQIQAMPTFRFYQLGLQKHECVGASLEKFEEIIGQMLDPKPDAKPEAKPEGKPEAKTDVKPDVKTDVKKENEENKKAPSGSAAPTVTPGGH